jgi:S1/P1 Nuclease
MKEDPMMTRLINRTLLRRATALLLLTCFTTFSASTSFGWGAGGHMMVAQIAFQRLNANAKAHVEKLLAIPIDPKDVTAESENFVDAAHWADDVKNLPDFEFSPDLHFIDYPFSADKTKLPTDLPKKDNIVKALTDYVNTLKTSTDENEQAEALRFIIHLVGDIHQPLHCATRVTKKHPEGDRGGNDFAIKLPGADGKLNKAKLHS